VNDQLISYLLDPFAHPQSWIVISSVLTLLLLQGIKSRFIPWDPPAKWLPYIASGLAFLGSAIPVLVTSASPAKALLMALLAAFVPQGLYSTLFRPVLATPPASVAPPGIDPKATVVAGPKPADLAQATPPIFPPDPPEDA
jgi:hypothetical protein